MPTEDQIKDMRWAVRELRERQDFYRLYGEYYEGAHRLMIDEPRLRTIFGRLFRNFRLNLCSAVVDALADRLRVQSFSSEERVAMQDAQDIWKANRMRRQAGEVHQTAISHGDAFVLVWPDGVGNPIFYPQQSHEVCVKYDAEQPGKIVKAAKLWQTEEKSWRLNLYYPERIEKYATQPRSAGATVEAQSFDYHEAEGETWPLENRFGEVPVFHFANNAGLGKPGVSELKDAVPVQDWLNYSVFSLLTGQEFQAFPQRYAIGVEVPKDADGKPVNPFKAGPERVWVATGSDGETPSMGQFPAANLDQLLNVKREIGISMAQVTGTPPHYFMLPSGLVSGESQKTAEQKLDSKVSGRQAAFGDTWAAAMTLAVRMRRLGSMDGLEMDTNWADTKPRNERETWEIAGMKAERGVPDDQLLREQGYSDEQVSQFASGWDERQARESRRVPTE